LVSTSPDPVWNASDLSATSADPAILDLAEVMVENALGVMPVPLGIAQGFLIDGVQRAIPLATEEPSVIAAASFAGSLIARHGGITTSTAEPLMTGQIYLEPGNLPGPEVTQVLLQQREGVPVLLSSILQPMAARGGGYRGLEAEWLEDLGMVRVHFHLDVRDAMGANLINTCAEALRPWLEELSGGSVIMAILTNQALGRLTRARFSLPFSALKRGTFSGPQMAQRMVRGYDIARLDPARAVTHNKGIMNGISSLALATANDTRGIEAAAHAYAARNGRYTSLTRYWIEEERLYGAIEVPLPFAVVGGGVGFHPAAQAALKVLGHPSATELSAIAAALGLAQNYAALAALTGEGIQSGHMRLHGGRLAYSAGARGDEISRLQTLLSRDGTFNIPTARRLLEELRWEKEES